MSMPDRVPRATWRLRLVVCSAILAALAFIQRPGLVVADTKLDLAINPIGFLARALHLWDPSTAFGQVQNQAYGYWLPMGPFFAFGQLAGLPGWITQRLWLAALLVGAFLGVVRLCRLLGVESPTVRLIAGAAYALSPRLVTTLGPISIEALPAAMAPWVLIPLISGSLRGSPLRSAARSGLAVGLVGGVNAAATAAVLPLGALWLLTRRAGSRRALLLAWWVGCVALATLWWVIPLLLLGRFSPPFLDFIENSAVTTVPTTVVDSLRGASHWVPYVSSDWVAGGQLLRAGWIVLDTVLIAALGLAGIARRENPHRLFLSAGLCAGLLLVTFGHQGPVQGWFAGSQNALLDGMLAPIRNVHKFDPVIRLPLVLGMAHLLDAAAARTRSPQPAQRLLSRTALAVAVVMIGAVASPMWLGRLSPPGAFAAIPPYWQQTADWLAEHDSDGRALLLPASKFGEYVWGRPHDEAIQPLARSPWAVRDGIPLAQPQTIAMLDAIQQRLADGTGSPGLAPFLRMSGVDYLVVRNDLDQAWTGAVDPALVHQALDASPGIRRVAEIGPAVGGDPLIADTEQLRLLADSGVRSRYPAVEIFAVDDPPQPSASRADPAGGDVRIDVETTSQVPVMEGGPAAELAAFDAGVIHGPVLLAADRPANWPLSRYVLTDGRRRLQVAFGSVDGNRSATLTRDEPSTSRLARDYTADDQHETVAVVDGARRVTASTSGSDADSPAGADLSAHPLAAFDGDPGTSWHPRPGAGPAGQWLQIDFDRSVPLADIAITMPRRPSATTGWSRLRRIRLTTATAERTVEVPAGARTIHTSMPGDASTLRMTIEAADSVGERAAPAGIAEVSIPGVRVRRWLQLPAAELEPDTVLLTRGPGDRDGCVSIGGTLRCDPRLVSTGEEGQSLDRIVELPGAASYAARLTALPRAGASLERLIWGTARTRVAASSRSFATAKAGPMTVMDDDIGTGWIANANDPRPRLTVRFDRVVRANSVSLPVFTGLAAARVSSLRIGAGGTYRTVTVDGRGNARFPALRGSVFTLDLQKKLPAASLSSRDSGVSELPVGVSELRLFDGAKEVTEPGPPSTERVRLPCGSGPVIEVNQRRVPTTGSFTRAGLLSGRPVRLDACTAGVELGQGQNRIRLRSSSTLKVVAGVFETSGTTTAGSADDVAVAAIPDRNWGPERRRVDIGTRERLSILAVGENANPGWRAVLGSVRLQPIVVNGWQQGWIVPLGDPATLRLTYLPDRTYRDALPLGALGILIVLLLATTRTAPVDEEDPALRTIRPHPLFTTASAVLVLGMIGGWAAVAIGASVLVLGGIVRRLVGEGRANTFYVVLAGSGLGAAGLLYGVRPFGTSDGTFAGAMAWPQLAALVSIAAVLTSGAALRRPSARNRRSGDST
jgi:arabinofuranan 3-O-arabinosyltransferase